MSGGGWTLTDHTSRSVSSFDSAGKLTSIRDGYGQSVVFAYSGSTLSSISGTRGGSSSRVITVTFAGGRITGLSQLPDGGGAARSVSYGYTGSQLTSITDAGRG